MLFPDNLMLANLVNVNDDSQLRLMIQVISIILCVLFFYNNLNAADKEKKKNLYTAEKINASVTDFDSYNLTQNTPNPFSDSTDISFSIPQKSKVILEIYNDKAETVKILVNDIREAGTYTVPFSCETESGRLPAGIYYYRLKTTDPVNQKRNEFVDVKRMIVVE